MDEHWRSCFATVCVGAGIWYLAAVHPSLLGDQYQMMHLRFAVSVVRTLVDETNARRRSCCVVFQAIWYSFGIHRHEQSVFIAGTPRMLYVLFPLSGLACARTSGIFTVSGAICPRTLTSGPVQSQMNHYPRNGIWYAGQSTWWGQSTAP